MIERRVQVPRLRFRREEELVVPVLGDFLRFFLVLLKVFGRCFKGFLRFSKVFGILC